MEATLPGGREAAESQGAHCAARRAKGRWILTLWESSASASTLIVQVYKLHFATGTVHVFPSAWFPSLTSEQPTGPE